MKLNPDCIRDILICIEGNDFGAQLTLKQLNTLLLQYTKDELHYTCLKLSEGGYLDLCTLPIVGQNVPAIHHIGDLTIYGHEFLSDIRSDNAWNKTKEVAKNIGSTSLSALKEIASNVISDLIKSQFTH